MLGRGHPALTMLRGVDVGPVPQARFSATFHRPGRDRRTNGHRSTRWAKSPWVNFEPLLSARAQAARRG